VDIEPLSPLTHLNCSDGVGARRSDPRGFTLVEVLCSLGLLTLVVTTSTWALIQMNGSATANRIYTCAEAITQSQIDAFLSAKPYSPQLSQIPAELVVATTTPTVTIYNDPNGNLAITGTLTRTVADLGLTQTTNGKTDNLDARSLSVSLTYTFKGKNYTVALGTVRSSDF
jgi:prepilin-type N-terminal cleavage/methylation domain-containing protein